MTSMMEKPTSNKAKSFNRFTKKHDHGTVANKRLKFPLPIDKDGTILERSYLESKGVPLEDDASAFDDMSPAELEAVADKILHDAESDQNVLDFVDRQNEGFYDAAANQYFDAEYSVLEQLEIFKSRLDGLKSQLEALPAYSDTPGYEPVNTQRLNLEGKIDVLIADIRDLLGESNYPEAAYGQENNREFNKRMARAATLDYDYDQDDHGDKTYKYDSHVNIRTAPKSTK